MQNVILATHRQDFPVAGYLQDQLEDAAVAVFDPYLLERSRIEGLSNARLIDWVGCDTRATQYPRARQMAIELERKCEQVLTTVVPEMRDDGWQLFNLFYLLYTVNGYSGLANYLARNVQDTNFHIVVADAPYRYGYGSFLPSLVLLEHMKAQGVTCNAYSYPPPPQDVELIPNVRDVPAGRAFELFSHLPTCFSDRDMLEREILASGRTCLNLRSQYYDIGLDQLETTGLMYPDMVLDGLGRPTQDKVKSALAQVDHVLDQELAKLLASEPYRRRQVDSLVAIYRAQLAFFLALEERFAKAPPNRILLSNHDMMTHGPIRGFARRHGIPLVLVPHSKIYNAPVHARGLSVTCLTHAIQGREIWDTAGRRLPSSLLACDERISVPLAPAGRLQTLGLILSGLSYNGLHGADLGEYMAGVRRILDWGAAHGIACRIRCKPNESFACVLSDWLGVSIDEISANLEGSIGDFAATCDCCLLYDAPTSGVVDILARGIPVLHAVERSLNLEEECLASAAIVPHLPVSEILSRLAALAADACNLHAFRGSQLAAYVNAQATAMPLRLHL